MTPERSRIWLPWVRNGWKVYIVSNQHHFLITYIWDALNVNVFRTKLLLNSTEKCSNHEFLLEQPKNYQGGKTLTQRLFPGPTTWKDMLKNALGDIGSWQTIKWSSYTKSQVLAWMTTISRRRNLNQLENYQQYAPKLSWHVCTWHELVDQTLWVEEKWCKRISCLTEVVFTIGLCVPRFPSEQHHFTESETGDQIATSNSPRARGTTSKFGKRRVHREKLFKSVNLMTAIHALPDLNKEHKTKLCSKKDAPAE